MEVEQSDSMEVEQSVGVLHEVMTPIKDIYPVSASTQGNELTGGEVAVSSATKQGKFPGAGQLYEEGKHCQDVLGEEFEHVGGFTVLKTQASLYKDIWLNYGHIASSQVLPDFYYSSQVSVVSELMRFIVDMNCCPLEEISSDVIDSWEKKIKVAEKLEFNVVWLRERLEDIKKILPQEKKLQETLAEQDQAKARIIEAEQQLVWEKERHSALESRISPLLKKKQNFVNRCGGSLLLLNSGTNLLPVTSPVPQVAIVIEESMDDNNSKTLPSPVPGIAAPTCYLSRLQCQKLQS